MPSLDDHPESRIPFVDLALQNNVVRPEVEKAWQAAIDRSQFILGDQVADFEREFASYCGVSECIAVANGTDALEICLRAIGIESGDEVLVPAFTFVGSATPILRAQGNPVFVDVDPQSLLIDCKATEASIGPRTTTILAVHLYGQMAPMEELAAIADRHGLALIEDGAQSQGATRLGRGLGQWSRAAATSFYPAKNLGAWGDGRAVLTNDSSLASLARRIRNHGAAAKYDHSIFGFNSRLDALQSVVLRAKLQHLDGWNRDRSQAAALYNELLGDVSDINLVPAIPGNEHVWHLYVARLRGRDQIAEVLKRRGVETGVHYPDAVPQLGPFKIQTPARSFPIAESAASSVLSLPMFPGITPRQQEITVDYLLEAIDGAKN